MVSAGKMFRNGAAVKTPRMSYHWSRCKDL
jgi:hypothetical protein